MDSFNHAGQIVQTYDSATPEQKKAIQEVKKQNDRSMVFDKQPGMDDEKEDEDNDIMSHLNYRKLQKIKEDFKKQDESLSLQDFIKVMLHHLPETRDMVGLVKNLIELFRQIDVNGDEQLDWDEFTGHIIEMGMVRKDSTDIDTIKNYFPSDIQDDVTHDTEVEAMFYIEKIKHLLVMERDQKRFKVYDCKRKTVEFKQNVPDDIDISKKGGTVNQADLGSVIAADYVEYQQKKYVATTSNNQRINFWDCQNYTACGNIPTVDIQMCIKWCGENVNKLFTGGLDKQIHAYDIRDMSEWNNRNNDGTDGTSGSTKGGNTQDEVYHTDYILDLLPIPELNFIASASQDTNLCLWDMTRLEGKSIHTDHQKEIYSLDWVENQKLILSAGLDHDIFIWNPIVKTRINVLKGHNHSLVGVKWLKGTNQIVSADISGMFRIWDARTFTTVQTFNCPLNEINCFSVMSPPKRIVAGGRKMIFYDYNEPTNNHLADDQPCINVLYNHVFYTMITAHPKCIKIWDATTGALQSVFRDLTKKEITSICLDNRKRKLFVGDSKGHIQSINIKNGARMKKFKKEGPKSKSKDKEDISSLYYWGDQDEQKNNINTLLAASWDGKVRLYDDKQSGEEGDWRWTMDRHSDAVNYLDFRKREALCASCGDDGVIIVFNYNTHRLEGTLKFDTPGHDTPAAVKVCKFLEGTDILVSADLDGYILFWCVTSNPHIMKNKLLCYIRDESKTDVADDAKPPYFPIRAIDYDPEEQMLYTGDEMGYLIKWDVSKVIDKLQMCMPKDLSDESLDENGKKKVGKTTFFTQPHEQTETVQFHTNDIEMIHRWQAHQDLINQVTFIPELEQGIIASCSFDCNVYMWRKEDCSKCGSLVLGTGLAMSQSAEQTAAEKRKYSKIWQIRINKEERRLEDRKEAEMMLQEAQAMNYETMFLKGSKDQAQDSKRGAKEGQVEKKAKDKSKKDKNKKNFDDELEPPNVSDHQILQGIMDKSKLSK